jgi:hypothetical protein
MSSKNHVMIILASYISSFWLLFRWEGSNPSPIIDHEIFRSKTEVLVQNKPQWKVTILNDRICTRFQIKLACDGFQAVEDIASSILSVGDDEYHINHEQPLYRITLFMPIYSEIACSWGLGFRAWRPVAV